MSATIYQFVPKPNPNRECDQRTIGEVAAHYDGMLKTPFVSIPTDCGNAIWPWPEKDGA